MIAAERLKNVLKGTKIPHAEGEYYGKADKYIVWSETANTDTDFADNEPVEETTSFVVHYVCKDAENDDARTIGKMLAVLLRKSGFYVTNREHITNKREDYTKEILYINLVN